MQQNSEYPETDFPYNFYFNGKAMPKWSAQWNWVFHKSYYAIPDKLWNEFIDINHLWLLSCRIDHIGVVESEDVDIFILCAQAVLEEILSNKDEMRIQLNDLYKNYNANEVFSGIRDGLFEMLRLSYLDKIAFWTTGYQEDLNNLVDYIKKSKLSPSDPEYLEPPHIIYRRNQLFNRRTYQLKSFARLSKSKEFDKITRKK